MTTLDFDRLEALYEATRVPEGWGGPLGEWVIDTHAAFPALLAAARRAERYERALTYYAQGNDPGRALSALVCDDIVADGPPDHDLYQDGLRPDPEVQP